MGPEVGNSNTSRDASATRSAVWAGPLPRILLTGATGRLGVRLLEIIAPLAEEVDQLDRIHLTARRSGRTNEGLPVEGVDLGDRGAVIALVQRHRPDIVLHLGAVSSVSAAAADHQRALEINVLGTEALCEAATEIGALIAFASTDFVFDGRRGNYDEDDVPHPGSHYGRTKLAAELTLGSEHLAVRMPMLFGRGTAGATSLLDNQIAALLLNRPVQAYDDEFRSPLSLTHAASALLALALERHTGVIHVAGRERRTPFDLLHDYARHLHAPEPRIVGVPRDHSSAETRPRDVSLQIGHLISVAPHLAPPSLEDDIRRELYGAGEDRVMLRRTRRSAAPPDDPHTPERASTRSRPCLNVLIPAHQNDEAIGRCLASLGAQSFLERGRLRVIVVCNNCSDATPAVANRWLRLLRRLGVETVCLDVDRGGRANAFNEGERHCIDGPRVYLDADVYLSPTALDELFDLLAPESTFEFAVPDVVAVAGPSAASRSYARLWRLLPYVVRGGSTMGMYAVSERGRSRWRDFPPIHSDDKFARLHFLPEERGVARTSAYHVEVPENVTALYRARVRYEVGNRELAARFPELAAGEPRRYRGLLTTLAPRPRLWAAATYVGTIQAVAAVRSRRQQVDAAMGQTSLPMANDSTA